MRITKRDLQNMFKRAAEAKGWNTGPAYVEGKAQIGATFLEHNSIYGWNVSQIVNDAGGERRLQGSCRAVEMYQWLRGVAS